jgi:hypothetical protein
MLGAACRGEGFVGAAIPRSMGLVCGGGDASGLFGNIWRRQDGGSPTLVVAGRRW